MAYEAWENRPLSVDIHNISTIDLPDQSWSSMMPRRGCITLVDDLDKKGDLFFSELIDVALRSQQYTIAMHLIISSDNLLGHCCRWSFRVFTIAFFSKAWTSSRTWKRIAMWSYVKHNMSNQQCEAHKLISIYIKEASMRFTQN